MRPGPQSDLKLLKKNLDREVSMSELNGFSFFLSSKYGEVACWIKQKETIENPQLLDKARARPNTSSGRHNFGRKKVVCQKKLKRLSSGLKRKTQTIIVLLLNHFCLILGKKKLL